MMLRLSIAFCLLTAPALADTSSALSEHVLPGYGRLAEATSALQDSALADCRPDALRPAFHVAHDAWITISHIQFGPLEDLGLSISMTFWPDPKDRTGKALARLITAQDTIVDDPDRFSEVSAAAQGFTALERLLYDPQSDTDYACRLTQAIATGLAEKSARLNAAWPEFANLMLTAGGDGNTRFQSSEEAQRALFTSLSSGLEFLDDQRLGRPLGSFERPRPKRAEARRSERSLHHIQLSLATLEDLASHLSDKEGSRTETLFAKARARARDLDDPTLAGVADPTRRIRIEALQQIIRDLRVAIVADIGAPSGISAGFNSLDGD